MQGCFTHSVDATVVPSLSVNISSVWMHDFVLLLGSACHKRICRKFLKTRLKFPLQSGYIKGLRVELM